MNEIIELKQLISFITLRSTFNKILGDILIYNVTCRTTYQIFVLTSETIIDVADLVKGIYFLSADGSTKLKFIKQ